MAKKQERFKVLDGEPKQIDMQEGTISIRHTNEGLAMYVKYKNTLYKSLFNRDEDPYAIDKLSSLNSITSLTDSTGGTASDTCDDTTSGTKDDLASIIAKIEEILKALRKHKLIKE